MWVIVAVRIWSCLQKWRFDRKILQFEFSRAGDFELGRLRVDESCWKADEVGDSSQSQFALDCKFPSRDGFAQRVGKGQLIHHEEDFWVFLVAD